MTDNPFLKGYTEEQAAAFGCALRNAIKTYWTNDLGPTDDVKEILKECIEFEDEGAFVSMATGVTLGILMMGLVIKFDCQHCTKIGNLHETVH